MSTSPPSAGGRAAEAAPPDQPARRRPPRDQVRRALLDAAAHVFARRGIDAASVEDVAAAAGYTKGAVYSNFGSKAGLVDALVEDRTSAYLDLGLAAVDDAGGTLVERARALGDRLTAASEEQRDWHLLFLELWQRAVRTPEPDGAFADRRRALHAGVTAAVEEHARQTGAPLPMPAADLATLLMALSNGLAIERLVAPDEVPADLLGRLLAIVVAAGEGPGAAGPVEPPRG